MDFADDASLIEYLRANDAPCLGCGYSLLGLGSLTCPECGRKYRARDVGQSPRPAWQMWAWSGKGWLTCAGLLVVLYLWETRVILRPAPWYDLLFRGRYNGPVVPGCVGALLIGWVVMRIRTRSRSAAEPSLKLAWFTLGFYAVAVGVAFVLMMV